MRDWFDGVNKSKLSLYVGAVITIPAVVVVVVRFSPVTHISYFEPQTQLSSASDFVPTLPVVTVTHLPTPKPLKGVYMTACAAESKSFRDSILSTISDTEINAIIIDIKDYTGTLAYKDTKVIGPTGHGCRISDLPELLGRLHTSGLYTIARVTVFQDPLYADNTPDIAVQSIASAGKPWRDRKGLAYIDPNFESYWRYIVNISREAYDIGFDEVNFDYIRFPSDGNMKDAQFAMPSGSSMVVAIEKFFKYLQSELKPIGLVMSADIFGQTTVDYDDLGIGQVLESVLPYFDYVMPMVYPSHFANGFMDYDNPADYPYEVILSTMIRSVERSVTASSSPDKIRPWLQAFDYKAIYTPAMVKKQIQGVLDAGLDSWILWDAANKYNKESLK